MCESELGDTGPSVTSAASASTSVGHVNFSHEEATITMVQVPEACECSDGKYGFKFASQQCIERILAHPPATFHAELKGTNLKPHLRLVLKTRAVQALPLLSDIHQEALAGEHQGSVTVPFNPPCSVWSLVTVLLLLEGDVTIEGWLGHVEHDISLAARTLEMADFLRVTSLVQGIQEWLRGRTAVARSIGLSRTIWHNSQVLVAVPQRFCRSIFLGDRDPADTIRESIRLYAPVFCKWLQGAAPSLDLRAASLHLLDWSRLFAFLQEVPEVVEMHVRGEAEQVPGSPRGPMPPVQSNPSAPGAVDTSCILSEGFLKAIEAAAQQGHLKHIKSLAIHSTTLHPEQIPAFQQALAPLHNSLRSLAITSADFAAHKVGQKPFSAGDKWMFCRAVGKLSCLKSLKLPAALWKKLMSDGEDVSDPLWRVEGLVVQDCETGAVLGSGNGGQACTTS